MTCKCFEDNEMEAGIRELSARIAAMSSTACRQMNLCPTGASRMMAIAVLVVIGETYGYSAKNMEGFRTEFESLLSQVKQRIN